MSKDPLNLNELFASDLLGSQSNADTLDGLDSDSFMRRDMTTTPTIDDTWELGSSLLRWKKLYVREIELDGDNIFEYMMKRNQDNYPTLTDTWDLGSALLRWRNIYAQKVYADAVYIKNPLDSSNIALSVQELGHYLRDDKINEPIYDKVYDFGTTDKKWRSLYVYNIYGETITATDKFIGDLDGVALRAKYADLAEIYKSDMNLKVGTVVSVDDNNEYEIVSCNSLNLIKTTVGVISEAPAYLMNKDEQGLPTGLTGKLNVRIIGPVNKGDIIIPTGNNGTAKKLEDDKDYIYKIGIAIETNLDENEKLVMCIIK